MSHTRGMPPGTKWLRGMGRRRGGLGASRGAWQFAMRPEGRRWSLYSSPPNSDQWGMVGNDALSAIMGMIGNMTGGGPSGSQSQGIPQIPTVFNEPGAGAPPQELQPLIAPAPALQQGGPNDPNWVDAAPPPTTANAGQTRIAAAPAGTANVYVPPGGPQGYTPPVVGSWGDNEGPDIA